MRFEHLAVIRTEKARVSDFYGITKILRELLEEIIEAVEEFLGHHAMALKLEEEGTGMRLKACFTVRSQDELVNGV